MTQRMRGGTYIAYVTALTATVFDDYLVFLYTMQTVQLLLLGGSC